MTFTIKRGDTSPSIAYELLDSDGRARDLSGYNAIKFYMRDDDFSVVVSDDVSGNVTVIDAQGGQVKYNWQSGDTDTAGLYQAEWEVTFGDGSIETFPNNDYIDVKIKEDIE